MTADPAEGAPMNATAAVAILPDLAAQINRAHGEVEERIRAAVPHAIRAGELLLQAKAALPHGAFGEWISENCVFSERTAQGYMRLSKILPTLDPAKAQRVAEMPLRAAVRELGAPRGTWDAAAKNYLKVCRQILDETSTGDPAEWVPILGVMIADLETFKGYCEERRYRAQFEISMLLREGAAR